MVQAVWSHAITTNVPLFLAPLQANNFFCRHPLVGMEAFKKQVWATALLTSRADMAGGSASSVSARVNIVL